MTYLRGDIVFILVPSDRLIDTFSALGPELSSRLTVHSPLIRISLDISIFKI